jgi:hypothetical protein
MINISGVHMWFVASFVVNDRIDYLIWPNTPGCDPFHENVFLPVCNGDEVLLSLSFMLK